MKDEILTVYKNPGETPLERLNRLRIEKPELSKEKLSYLGRLDPLAEGVLVVAVGEANKKRKDYLNLEKEYVVDILCGAATDTHDVLGLVEELSDVTPSDEEITKAVTSLIHLTCQTYPDYSSKPVQGIPLFAWARKGLLHMIKKPTRPITIGSSEVIGFKTITPQELQTQIQNAVSRVKGDFRQEEILKCWKNRLESRKEAFKVVSVKVICSGGVYMRSLAHELGIWLKTKALALHIKRIRVGKFTI